MTDLKLFFSLISGDMYYVCEDEVQNLDNTQIPLLKKPNSSCKKCYGRFYSMYNSTKKFYQPCPKCMKKCVDWDSMKKDDVVIESPKTTHEIADHSFIMEAEKMGI